MADIITKTFDIWTTAQTLKTSGRGIRVDNQSLLGIKKLRDLILELAVRGKLVPQFTNDEPASELLKKIEVEKRRLVKEEQIKKQEGSTDVGEDEKPFDLPKGWAWTRIRSVGHDWGQKTPDTDFTYIEVSAIDNTKGEVKSPTILTASEAPSRARKIIKPGTVIYSTVRPYLKNICVIDQEYSPEPIASTAFAILHPYVEMPGRFFLFYFQSPVFVNYVESVQNGIAYPAINDKQFFSGVLPLPPLAEQHRIVAKVDELMALCDQLEQQQTGSNAAHVTLVEFLLDTLTNAENPAEFDEAWQRIAAHFDTLFTTEHSIDQLKQTILQLAVTGKLTPQNPEDEPASELLKNIANEKARLVKEGVIKKQAPLPGIAEEEKPFELPRGWAWVRLGIALKKITDGTHFSPPNGESGEFLYISAKNIKTEGVLLSNATYITKEIHDEIYSRCDPEFGDILYIKDGATTGIVTINNLTKPFSMLSSVALLKVPDGILNRYLLLSLTSPYFYNEMRSEMTGVAITRVTLNKLNKAIITLPPLTEQHRIVSKVDELFALCDTLKERINQAQTTQNQLAGAVVEKALSTQPKENVIYTINEQINLAAEPE